MSKSTSRLHVENRITVVLIVVVVAALTFALVVLAGHSEPPRAMTDEAGSHVRPQHVPTVKLGHYASASASFDGFRATFRATATKGTRFLSGQSACLHGDAHVSRYSNWTLPQTVGDEGLSDRLSVRDLVRQWAGGPLS